MGAYYTKAKAYTEKGAGDFLIGFLGVVVLSFGFHVYFQRAVLLRHVYEVLGCVTILSLISLVATCAAGRLLSLPPDLTLAIAPRSVTVALAMPIAEQLGVPIDMISVTAATVLVT